MPSKSTSDFTVGNLSFPCNVLVARCPANHWDVPLALPWDEDVRSVSKLFLICAYLVFIYITGRNRWWGQSSAMSSFQEL